MPLLKAALLSGDCSKRRMAFFWIVFTSLFHGTLSLSLEAQQSVRYNLRFPNAAHHEAEVSATFSGVSAPVLEVVMSRSSPGRYAPHDFAKNIYNVSAADGEGHKLDITRPNPYGWNIVAPASVVVVRYTLFGDRADGTYDAIDETHAHLNMPATLV